MLLETLVKARLNIRKSDTSVGPYSGFSVRLLGISFLLYSEIIEQRDGFGCVDLPKSQSSDNSAVTPICDADPRRDPQQTTLQRWAEEARSAQSAQAHYRIVVEHTIAQMNRFGVLWQVFRRRRESHAQLVRIAACLVNRQIQITPLRTYVAA
jgi:hypothetical protein